VNETPSETRPPGLWATLRESLRGGERDYTTETIGRAVVLLAVPMVLEMAMESVFAIADVWFVSRLGVDAVAAVGLTEAMVTIIYAVAVGLSMSTTAMVARRIGEKDPEGAADSTVQAIGLGVVVAVVIAIPGGILAPKLLGLMGGSPELVAQGAGYTRVMLAGNLTIVLLFLLNAVFRGAGDAALAMRVLWLANGINLVLDPCLIFGLGPFPELGLTGAAIATTIGRGVGVGYQLLLLFRGRGAVRLERRHFRLKPAVMLRLMRVSLGGIGQFLISTSSWVVLVKIVGGFGSVAVAGYTIAIRIIVFALMPSWGVSNAASTLVGQNLGARRPDRAEKSVWRVGIYNAGFLGTVTVVFVVFAEKLVGIFTPDPAVRAVGTYALRVIALGYPTYAFGMVMTQAFNGSGDTATPTKINFFCYWCFQIPLAWALAHHAGLAERGVFLAILFAEFALTGAGLVMFRRGAWKRKEI
jgi:putative MATE family efflux protein